MLCRKMDNFCKRFSYLTKQRLRCRVSEGTGGLICWKGDKVGTALVSMGGGNFSPSSDLSARLLAIFSFGYCQLVLEVPTDNV